MEFDIMEQQAAAIHYCGTFIRKAFDAVFFSQMSRKKITDPEVKGLETISISTTGKLHRLERCFLDWTNQCKSHLPLVAKSAFLQTATAAHISGPIYEAFFCSGSLKPGSFGYLWQTALALIGPI